MSRIIVIGSAVVLGMAMTAAAAQKQPQNQLGAMDTALCCEWWCPQPLSPKCNARPNIKRSFTPIAQKDPQNLFGTTDSGLCCEFWCTKPLSPKCSARPSTKPAFTSIDEGASTATAKRTPLTKKSSD
jgi:hypothetical protein